MSKTQKDPKQKELPIQPAVEEPIINSPFYEPTCWWDYVDGKAHKTDGRRKASYFWTTKKTGSLQEELFSMDQGADDLPLVNALREDLKKWRKSNYQNATPVTKELLRHWSSKDRDRRLFFCQLEAVETVVYLSEIVAGNRRTQFKAQVTHAEYQRLIKGERPDLAAAVGTDSFFPTLADQPADKSLDPLIRYGCKMATGSGKTVVMAMLITWAFCNRGRQPGDPRFPNRVLIVAPNLTVKERLQVLRPNTAKNYFDEFDMAPHTLRPLLGHGRVMVTNWHQLSEESPHKEGDSSYKVVNKGLESPDAFATRVLRDLDVQEGEPIWVFNDEAHHAYRPKPKNVKADKDVEVEKASRDDLKEATVWVEGLDKINESAGIGAVVDLSATPFYLQGTGHIPGSPFPWLISDFGLVDAIESGITKIPRLPVSDTTGLPDPQFFELWKHIKDKIPKAKIIRGKPDPEEVWREANPALTLLAAQWKERFDKIQKAKPGQEFIPPVMIVVCDNVNLAQHFFEQISGERTEEVEIPGAKGKKKKQRVTSYNQSQLRMDEFRNTENQQVTLRIDTELLSQAESSEGGNKQQEAERLREQIANVGEQGTEGQHIRCVVSVQMLTEGWDANNVTQILGLRAFGSPLLCEQVVGRGLRRMNYKSDTKTEMLPPEYVDVYGIPFSVIPYKGRPKDTEAPEDKPKNHVRAIPNRSHLRIEFPIVEGYTVAFTEPKAVCDFDQIEVLEINPTENPSEVFVMPQVGIRQGELKEISFETEHVDREEYYRSFHFQTIQFGIAREVCEQIAKTREEEFGAYSRAILFPQVLEIVEEFCDRKVDYAGQDRRELAVERYYRLAVEKLRDSIQPAEVDGKQPPILPIINRFTPRGSSDDVSFITTRPCHATMKSHVDQVVLDTKQWEQAAAFHLEASKQVESYLRVDGSGFRIPYEFLGVAHSYHPDFIVRMVNGVSLILEVKGYENDQDKAKYEAARKWCKAVTNWGKMGTWMFFVSKDPKDIQQNLSYLDQKVRRLLDAA